MIERTSYLIKIICPRYPKFKKAKRNTSTLGSAKIQTDSPFKTHYHSERSHSIRNFIAGKVGALVIASCRILPMYPCYFCVTMKKDTG